jgi:AcrR family transcriptional regulator
VRTKRDRRTEILDAARALFFKNGYLGTTMQLVAEQAGYSKRSAYLDYRNKDDLFVSICAEGGQLLLDKLRAIPADSVPVEMCIDRFLYAYIQFSREHAEYYRMIFSEATPAIIANCSPELRQRVADLERACLGVIVAWAERAMREGHIRQVNPWDAAGILVGTATGIVLLSMGGSQTVFTRERLESLATMAIRTFWRGLQPCCASPYRSRLQSGGSSGDRWAEERVEQPLGLEHAQQAQAEPGEMRRQPRRVE